MNVDDFRSKFGDDPSRDSLTILVEKTDDPSDQLFIFFPNDEKVGVKTLKTYCTRMKDEKVFRGIVIVRESLTPSARQAVKEMTFHGYKMEYFRDAELLVDITEHRLVPEHKVLTTQQKEELLERYRLKPTQLPRIQVYNYYTCYTHIHHLYTLTYAICYIQVSDPVARFLGLSVHQVVKIIRPSETAGRYITYRICY